MKLSPDQVSLPANERGRFLVTLYWPWVTAVRITARPLAGAATLTVRSASFWRTYDVGSARFEEKATVEIAAPPGAFDSGINEITLTSDAPIVLETWQWVDTSAHDTSIRLFE